MAGGKAGVNQDAAIFSLDVGAIAGRAAAEDGEFDGHKKKLKRKVESGKRKRCGRLARTFPKIKLVSVQI